MSALVVPSAKPPTVTYADPAGGDASLTVRPAQRRDADQIHALLEFWVASGAILRREVTEIGDNAGTFAVAEDEEGHLAACAALVVSSSRLAEVRSVATNPARQRKGAGRLVVEYLTDWASRLEIERVFLLTKTPGFFARCGFIAVEPRLLPDSFLMDYVHAQGRTATGKAVMILDFAAEY